MGGGVGRMGTVACIEVGGDIEVADVEDKAVR